MRKPGFALVLFQGGEEKKIIINFNLKG